VAKKGRGVLCESADPRGRQAYETGHAAGVVPIPDDAWVARVSGRLQGNGEWGKAVRDVGDPLFLKVKSEDESASVLLQLGDGSAAPAVTRYPGERVEGEDAIVVSMRVDTWERLLNGTQDLMSAFMGRDVKAKASMMKLMRIANPAETLLRLVGEAQRGA